MGVIYTFAGPARQADVGSFVRQLAPHLVLHEFDILRDSSHDLSSDLVWDKILALVRTGRWVFFSSPPYDTFSRARHLRPGPPPVRSMEFPYGFPWLRQSLSAQVSLANSFVSKSVQVALACSEAGGFFAFVHPESLGRVPGGDIPGSIWMWPEVLDLIPSCRAVTFAMFQCAFGAPNSKPTRFLGNLPLWVESVPCFPGLPRLDDSGQYVGPLPPRCGHNHKSLLRGLDASGAWRTASSAAYPPRLCAFLASAFVACAPAGRGGLSAPAGRLPHAFREPGT